MTEARSEENEKSQSALIEQMTSEADAHLWKNDFKAAIELYEKILAADPANFKAKSHEALAYARSGEYEKSLKLYDELLVAHPTYTDLLLDKANALRWSGNLEKAEIAYWQAYDKNPGYIPVLQGLGDALNALGKHREATEIFSQALKIDNKKADLWGGRAWAWRWLDNYQRSEEDLSRALALDPKNRSALELQNQLKKSAAMRYADSLAKADDLRAKGDLKTAAQIYDEVLEKDPANLGALARKAMAYSSGGEYARAVEIFNRLLSTDPDNSELLLNRARALRRKGDLQEAELAYRDAYAKHPKDMSILEGFAETLNLRGRHQEAIAIYDQGLTLDPERSSLWSGRAWAWRWLEDLPKASHDLSKALELDPRNKSALELKAQIYATGRQESVDQMASEADAFLWARDFSGALRLYDEILAKDPQNFRALSHKALAYSWNGEYDKAIGIFDQLRAVEPDNLELLLNRAAAFKRKGSLEDAETAYREAFSKNPNEVSALEGLAEILNLRSKHQEAIELYSQGIAFDEKRSSLWSGRAWAWYWLGIQTKTAQDLDQALALDPKNQSALELQARRAAAATQQIDERLAVADSFLWKRDISKAIQFYDEVLAKDPHNVRALSHKALAYSWNGEYEKAIKIFDRLLEKDPENSELLLNYANALRWKGDLVKAEAAYRAAFKKYPEDLAILEAFAETLNLRSKHHEAIEIYDQGLAIDEKRSSFWSGRAWAWYWLDIKTKAAQDVNRALTLDPKNASALELQKQIPFFDIEKYENPLAVADDFLDKNDYMVALRMYEAILQKDPKNLKAKGRKALAYARGRDYEASLRLYNELLAERPEDLDLIAQKADVLRWQGNLEEAEKFYWQAFDKNPENVQVAEGLAQTLNLLGKYESALEVCNKGITVDKKNVIFWLTRAWAWYWMGEIERSRQDLKKVFQLDVNNRSAFELQEKILRARTDFLITSADKDLWAKEFDAAIKKYDEALVRDPENFQALNHKGLAYSRSGRQAQALAIFEKLLEVYPDNPELLLNKANAQKWGGDPRAAEITYWSALEKRPASIEVREELADALNRLGKHKEAIELANEGIAINPQSVKLWLVRAWAWRWLGQPEKALEDLGQALQIDAENRWALELQNQILKSESRFVTEKADELLWKGEFAEAIRAYDDILTGDPKSFDARSHKALALARSKNYVQAIELYDELLGERSDDVEVLFNKADALKWKKDFPGAQLAYRKVLEKDPKNIRSFVGLADVLNRQGDHTQAVEVCDQGLLVDENNPELWVTRAWAWTWLQEYDKALQDVEQALKTAPDLIVAKELLEKIPQLKAEQLLFEADQALWAEDFAKALTKYEEILQTDPGNIRAQSRKALAYARSGDHDKAIAIYEDLLMSYNGDTTLLPGLLLDYGNTLKWKGELAKAETAYKNGITRFPNDLPLIEGLAETLNLEGKHKEAIELYDRAIAIRSDQVSFWVGKAWALRWLEDFESSREVLRKALEIDPENVSAKQLKDQLEIAEADSVLWKGDYVRAIALYGDILEKNPGNFIAQSHQALGYSWSGQYKKALKIYEHLLKEHPDDPDLLLNRAKTESWRGRFITAEKKYKQALKLYPLNVDLLCGLAETQSWQGKNQKAAKTYGQALKVNEQDPRLWAGRGWEQYWLGMYKRAERDLDRALQVNEKSSAALALQKKLDATIGPYVAYDFSYFTDSNNLKTYYDEVRTGWNFSSSTDLSFSYRNRIFRQRGVERTTANGAGIYLTQRLHPILQVNSQVFLDHYSHDCPTESFTTNNWITLTPVDFFRLDLGYERNTFDTLESLRNNVMRNIYKVGMDIRPWHFLTWRGSYNFEALNDSNRRSVLFSQLEWKALSRRPRLWLDYHTYYFKYSEQKPGSWTQAGSQWQWNSEGYWNPSSFLSQGPGLRIEIPLDRKERFVPFMYTALNYEIENPGEHKFGWMINGGLDVKLFERFTLRFSYNYLDSRVGYDNDNAYNSQRFSVSVKNNF